MAVGEWICQRFWLVDADPAPLQFLEAGWAEQMQPSCLFFKQSEKLGYPVKLSPRRIGPLDPDAVGTLGLGRLERRLVDAASGVEGAAAPRKGYRPRAAFSNLSTSVRQSGNG